MVISNFLIVVLVLVAVAALGVAAAAGLSMLQRRQVIARATGDFESVRSVVLADEAKAKSRVASWIEKMGQDRQPDDALQGKLVMAGYDQPSAPAYYFVLRTASFIVFPLIVLLVIPRDNFPLWVLMMVTAVFIGFILPAAMLDRTVRLRQERLRRSVPDALDLLVVCVEAGVSLDAAILRVSREIRLAHPELAYELGVVNRLTNAGITREQALRGLWQRTGVEDLRTLVSSLIQSERWGTSIATVLRVAAETLRRKRRQFAEKRAKQAPLKMTFPLLFFILPALFSVIFGPAIATVVREFGKV